MTLWAQLTWASGTPTLVTSNGLSKGVASVTDNGTGDVTLTLKDVYPDLMGYSLSFEIASAAASPIESSSAVFTSASKTLQIVHRDSAGTATDPADGTENIRIELRNSKS